MKTYLIRTDAWLSDEITAENIDAAITEAFREDGITSTEELKSHIEAIDGAWVWIDEDGVRVFEVGSHRG